MFPAKRVQSEQPATVKPPREPSHGENVRYSSDESSSDSDIGGPSKLTSQHKAATSARKRQ
jgi:hypothetical protein